MPRLTKAVVDRGPSSPKQEFVWCSELPGFGIRFLASGRQSYLVQYRTREERRTRRFVLGYHGHLTAEQARREAMAVLGRVAQGEDPAEEKVTRRRSITISELCDQYLEAADKGLLAGKRGSKKKSTVETDRGRINGHIKPLIGRKLVRDLKRADVVAFVQAVQEGKTERPRAGRQGNPIRGGAGAAARTTGLLGSILSFAVDRQIREDNPARGVRRPASKPRTARLAPEDYEALGGALADCVAEKRHASAIGAARLLALTGCRFAEILQLTWEEVDTPGHALRLKESKEGASTRPAGQAALDVLAALPRQEGIDVVLPGRGAEPYGGFRAEWRRIIGKAKLAGVTPHTLRHSFASVAGDLGYSESTIAALLGHSAGTVTGRYTHHLDAVLVAAADKVSAEIDRMMRQ